MIGGPPANKAQRHRMASIKLIGCLACRIDGRGYVPCEVHHLNEGGRHGGERRGHDFTIGLCPWHHRGTCREGWTVADMTAGYGSSWAHEPTRFSLSYGEDDRLLQYQNDLLRNA